MKALLKKLALLFSPRAWMGKVFVKTLPGKDMPLPEQAPFLIIGLGNPGERYQNTRHNMGFEALDRLWKKWGPQKSTVKFRSHIINYHGIPDFPSLKIILMRPETYMNNSGQAVLEALSYYKTEPGSHLLVILDDMDLPPGQLRIRKSGGSGGHKGLGSIIDSLQTHNFPRIRIGIGRSHTIPPESFVLMKIPPAERPAYDKALEICTKAVEILLKEGIDSAMNQFNSAKDIHAS